MKIYTFKGTIAQLQWNCLSNVFRSVCYNWQTRYFNTEAIFIMGFRPVMQIHHPLYSPTEFLSTRPTDIYELLFSFALLLSKALHPESSGFRNKSTKNMNLIPIVLPLRVVIAQSVYSWATGWTIGVLGFDSLQGLGIFLFTTASRPALGPTQPPIQWAPGALSLG
jgi:hypothetical protein